MVISPSTRSILIHIQKTGGSSVERALRAADPGIGSNLFGGQRHLTAIQFRELVAPDVWNSYLKFAFVRNPWDRLVSWHCMCMENPGNKFAALVRSRYADFGDFIRNGEVPELARTSRCQLDYLTDDAGVLLVDFIGRFENLADDFARLNLVAAPLPHVNRSTHRDYRYYFSDELRDIVADRFARDCDYFHYSFDEGPQ